MRVQLPITAIRILLGTLRWVRGFFFFGGLGAKGHQVFFGGAGTRPHACENQNNAMQKTHNLNQTERTNTVTPNNQKPRIPIPEILYQATCLSLLLLILSMAAACSTTCNRKFGMTEILSRQEELLNNLEQERRVVEIRGKVSKDSTLLTAEKHLQAAIKSLKASNAVLKSSL